MLSARLAAKLRRAKAEGCRTLRDLIGELQRDLRRKALALGQRLYREPPALFRNTWRNLAPQRTRAVAADRSTELRK